MYELKVKEASARQEPYTASSGIYCVFIYLSFINSFNVLILENNGMKVGLSISKFIYIYFYLEKLIRVGSQTN